MIKGDPTIIKMVKEANPSDKWNMVNLDAISRMPEQFDVALTKLDYDIKKDFYDVDDVLMPTPSFMRSIAEACGVSGGDQANLEPLIYEVDINRIRGDLNSLPVMVKYHAGWRCTKFATRMQEDGTYIHSSPCTAVWDAYQRACVEFTNEESETQGYSLVKNGEYEYTWDSKTYKKTGPHYMATGKGGKLYAKVPKYQTRWQRQKRFDELLKFASSLVETKAYGKAIKDITGIITEYNAEELGKGFFIFSKIIRSDMALKMEAAARLQALSRGQTSADLLFAPPPKQISETETKPAEIIPNHEPEPEPEQPQKTPREAVDTTLKLYLDRGLLDAANQSAAKKIIDWLAKVPGDPTESAHWQTVLDSFRSVDASVIEEGRIDHGL